MVREMRPDGSVVDDGRDDWKAGYDDSSSSGMVCVECHGLVPAMADHMAAHRQWHRDQEAKFEKPADE